MRKKITLLIASLAFLLVSNVIWGQQGVLLPKSQNKQVTPRRGDANAPGSVGYIVTPGNVNNEFGAGETATITGGAITWPNNNGIHTTPSSIQLGSQYSQNIVINTYNAGGGMVQVG